MPSLTHAPVSGHLIASWTTSCPECDLPGGACASKAEAVFLATVHDDLHHGGRPMARVRGAVACASCSATATRVVVVAEGMPPAALCAPCAVLLVDGASRPAAGVAA